MKKRYEVVRFTHGKVITTDKLCVGIRSKGQAIALCGAANNSIAERNAKRIAEKLNAKLPSRAAILRLCRAVRHEARDRGLWLEAETVKALNAVEKQLKRKGN